MADEAKVGESQSEAQGDAAANAAAAVASEAGAGDAAAADDLRADADRERDAYIAELVANATTKAVNDAMDRMGQQAAPAGPAATPPTPNRNPAVASLEQERAQLIADEQRLQQSIVRDGLTAENVVARVELGERKAEFIGRVNMTAIQLDAAERAVSAAGSEDAWKKYVADNPGVPIPILRKAYLHDNPTAQAPVKGAAPAGRPSAAVNISAPSEVSAGALKARTMTSAQFTRAIETADEAGDAMKVAELSRARRSGAITVKG